MDIVKRKYIEIIENTQDKNNCLEITLYYDLGGFSYTTYKEKPRGYYLKIIPMERKIKNGLIVECYTAFTGVVELIHPCTRKSAKAENIATEKAPAFEKMMLEYMINKNGYKIEV